MKFPFTLLKKCSIRIGVLSLAFSAMFLVVSSGIKAEQQDGAEKDLASELQLHSVGMPGPNMDSEEGKDQSNTLKDFSIPMKEGLSVFIEGTHPFHQEGRPQEEDARPNRGAVIGFRFKLG